jgi:uncharacterized membrane protein
MHVNLTPFLAIWSLIALAVLVLLAMRKAVASKEDDTLHVMHGTVAEQTQVATRLDAIDKWGKILTVVAVVFGLALAAAYIYDSILTRGA